jgi:hypothetical protein
LPCQAAATSPSVAGDGPRDPDGGARGKAWQVRHPVPEFAARHSASAAKQVSSPAEAYVGRFEPSRRGRPSDWDRLPWA